MSRLWRVGRSLGRTLYWQVGAEPSKDDVFVGIMDTVGLAAQVVAACNNAPESTREQTSTGAAMHDDLCPCINKGDKRWCECDLIAKVREDERATMQAQMADLRAKVEALKDEVGQALLHAETTDEVTAASAGISALDEVLALFDGAS